MSKKQSSIETATLSDAGRSRIVRAVSESIAAVGSTGNFLTRACETAVEVTKGLPISDEMLTEIMADVSRSDAVKALAPRTRDNVLSKYRTVLLVADRLPEAIRDVQKVFPCTAHDGFALASMLRKGHKVADAVRETIARIKGKKAAKSKTDYAKSAAIALKAWFRNARGDKKAAILRAAESLGLKIA